MKRLNIFLLLSLLLLLVNIPKSALADSAMIDCGGISYYKIPSTVDTKFELKGSTTFPGLDIVVQKGNYVRWYSLPIDKGIFDSPVALDQGAGDYKIWIMYYIASGYFGTGPCIEVHNTGNYKNIQPVIKGKPDTNMSAPTLKQKETVINKAPATPSQQSKAKENTPTTINKTSKTAAQPTFVMAPDYRNMSFSGLDKTRDILRCPGIYMYGTPLKVNGAVSLAGYSYYTKMKVMINNDSSNKWVELPINNKHKFDIDIGLNYGPGKYKLSLMALRTDGSYASVMTLDTINK